MKDYLKQFQFPEDLKEMDYDELELLSYEIRDFLIEKVSKTGGHLSSNLGAVELTIALHRCFDTPEGQDHLGCRASDLRSQDPDGESRRF